MMQNYFYSNNVLMEIFLQHCALVYSEIDATEVENQEKRENVEVCLDMLVYVLHQVVKRLREVEGNEVEIESEVQEIIDMELE
jgi:hypothetical protein